MIVDSPLFFCLAFIGSFSLCTLHRYRKPGIVSIALMIKVTGVIPRLSGDSGTRGRDFSGKQQQQQQQKETAVNFLSTFFSPFFCSSTLFRFIYKHFTAFQRIITCDFNFYLLRTRASRDHSFLYNSPVLIVTLPFTAK